MLQRACNNAGADPPIEVDGKWGPLSQAAFDQIVHGKELEGEGDYSVIASSFADPKDVAAFRLCKAKGKSDNECKKVGDNGIGAWGDATDQGSGPAVALPPETMEEMWGEINAARGRPVIVYGNGTSVRAFVKDKMPKRKNITNGAGIDLNPDTAAALGLVPPFMTRVSWSPA